MPDWQTLRIFMVNVLINALVALLVGGATLNFSFEAESDGGAGSSAAGRNSGTSGVQYEAQGTIVTEGDNYRMETQDALVYSDGAVMCIYQKAIDEVILQEAAAGAAGIANPFAVLIGQDSNYEVSAYEADSQGIPRKIVLKAKSGAKYTIRIKDYKKLPQVDPQQFVFRAEDFPTAVVTDLR